MSKDSWASLSSMTQPARPSSARLPWDSSLAYPGCQRASCHSTRARSMCMPSSALLHDASRCQSSPGLGSIFSYMPLTSALHCRHGARTPLNTLFWPDSPYSDCHNTYPGPEIRLFDETGLPNPPPVLDLVSEVNSPAAGWGVRV